MYKSIYTNIYKYIGFIMMKIIIIYKSIALTFRVTPGKRIPDEWRATGADGVVIDDVTESAEAAGAWTGVCTVLVDASLVESTL